MGTDIAKSDRALMYLWENFPDVFHLHIYKLSLLGFIDLYHHFCLIDARFHDECEVFKFLNGVEGQSNAFHFIYK